jgi:glucosamine--fructose-6-phosphate aminotransferase (isomerizing)
MATTLQNQYKASLEIFSEFGSKKVNRIFITGCGDSHHAALSSVLAFEQLARTPAHPQTAMQFARYTAPFINRSASSSDLILAISVSGEVSRTIEAVEQANTAGAVTIAVTTNKESSLAAEADYVLDSIAPALSDEPAGIVVPGSRSYLASLVALFAFATAAGTAWCHLSATKASEIIDNLIISGEDLGGIIDDSAESIAKAVEEWSDAGEFVFCGAGPNYGTALFSAAKILEASGDAALGQDLEEWAHLQFFARAEDTPTIVISGGPRDQDRAVEVALAAKTIGRRLAVVSPPGSQVVRSLGDDVRVFPTAPIRECFSPLMTCIPGMLLASERAELIDEPYFRDFGGGRSREGGGGISRIRTATRIEKPLE